VCGMCSDYVDDCGEGDCYNPELKRGKRRQFYLMDEFCEHLTEKWGTKSASMYWHVQYDHGWDFNNGTQYACEDECLENGWWTYEELDKVIKAIQKEYGEDGTPT